MTKERDDAAVATKLDRVIELLEHLVALELSRRGATQQAIGKSIRAAKATVVKMLAGTKKEGAND